MQPPKPKSVSSKEGSWEDFGVGGTGLEEEKKPDKSANNVIIDDSMGEVFLELRKLLILNGDFDESLWMFGVERLLL